MTVFTPPPSAEDFHAAYWRTQEDLAAERAGRQAEQQAADHEQEEG